jgi:hypothetical protein
MAAILAVGLATAAHAEGETPFDEAELFFELNNTDEDLGIHAVIDGDEWKSLTIEGPDELSLLDVLVRGRLRQQGLTEFNFESAEPPFDEVPPQRVFKRFPEGKYEIEGITLAGEELESVVELSHVMPAPPEFIAPLLGADSCEDPTRIGPPGTTVVIRWKDVDSSHPTVGDPGEIEVERYEVALERERPARTLFAEVPGSVTRYRIPDEFTSRAGVVKFEVLVKADNGNRTAEERCFELR